MNVSHAFMRLFDTTASFVRSQITTLPFSQLPYGAGGRGIQSKSRTEGTRQREERDRTEADEIDLFSEQKGQVTRTGGERRGMPGNMKSSRAQASRLRDDSHAVLLLQAQHLKISIHIFVILLMLPEKDLQPHCLSTAPQKLHLSFRFNIFL